MQNNLKPRKQDLLDTLDSYRAQDGASLSDLEFEVLSQVCHDSYRVICQVNKLAATQFSAALKQNLVAHFTSGGGDSPQAATTEDKEIYRISIPVGFAQTILRVAATAGGKPPLAAGDYYLPSAVIAIVAAYAHELTHVVVGHLDTNSSIAQETYADYIGGGLLAGWFMRDEIPGMCGLPAGNDIPAMLYGIGHMAAILKDRIQPDSIYLPRFARMAVFCGGAAFYADQTQGTHVGDQIAAAQISLRQCPDSRFHSEAILQQWQRMEHAVDAQTLQAVQDALKQITSEKLFWFQNSEHLRSIKKDLHNVAKQQAKQEPFHK